MFEDLKNKQRGGRPPRLIPGMSVADPKRRIIILVGLLVLLAFMAAMLKGYAKRPEAQEITGDEAPSREIPADHEKFSGVPALDRSYIEFIKDATPKERGKWDEEPISYLLAEARYTPAVLAYRRKLLPVTRESAAGIERDPAPWRFQFVRFRGKLEYIEEVDYADRWAGDEDIGLVHHGRVLVEGGDKPVRVKFVTPMPPSWTDKNAPEAAPEYQMIRDGWVRGRGIFVKNYNDVGPDGEEVHSLLVVAMKIRRDFETLPVESLESIPFQIIQDHSALLEDPEQRRLFMRLYPKTLFRLLRWAIPRAGEQGAALRAKEGLEPGSFKGLEDYEDLLANPAKYRAEYIGGLGALAGTPHYVGLGEMEADLANDAGIEEYVNGLIATDYSRLVIFVAPPSLGQGLKKRARIRYAGYFYKVQGYFARDGSRRMAPFLVLTELEELPLKPADTRLDLFIAAGFILGIALLIFIIVREDKTKQDYRRLRRKKVG